jgi:desulfoferrodoxin-like iron-binding protein
MTNKGEIYVCEVCGNKVQVLEEGGGTRLLWTRHDPSEIEAIARSRRSGNAISTESTQR